MLKFFALFLSFLLAVYASSRVQLHFESLCKQCQIHTAAIDDIVVHGGDEGLMGMLSDISLSVDYYGHADCEDNPYSIEHGPAMCVTDRYQLCAQELNGGTAKGAGAVWWPFNHCMMMNIDQLKCGVNTHCDTMHQFRGMLEMTVPLCAAVSSLNTTALVECAEGKQGKNLANLSYKRTDLTLGDGFAPVYINGLKLQGCDSIWRKTPDNVLYGKTMLAALCDLESESDATACPVEP